MLWYQYHLVAVFTYLFDIVFDPTMEVSRLQVYVSQASASTHSDTAACLVNRRKIAKK